MSEYTDITVLLDRSGSMVSIKSAMESAFKEFLLAHRQVPSSRISLIQFDSDKDQDVCYEGLAINLAPQLLLEPRGGTPLLDAFCKAIDRTGKRLGDMPGPDRPDQVLFVVITDGQENASREFKRKDVFDRVTRQRQEYKWQFVYLGANQDAIAEAVTFGIDRGQTMTYNATGAGAQSVSASMTANTMAFASRTSSAVPEFDDKQRKEAMKK